MTTDEAGWLSRHFVFGNWEDSLNYLDGMFLTASPQKDELAATAGPRLGSIIIAFQFMNLFVHSFRLLWHKQTSQRTLASD